MAVTGRTIRRGGPLAGPQDGPRSELAGQRAEGEREPVPDARYEIIDVGSGLVLGRHRTRQAAMDGWRIDHLGFEVRIDRVYRDGTSRPMVQGTWNFADDVHDSSPVQAPGPVPRPVEELLAALQRVAHLVEGALTSAAYQRLRSPSEPAARTVGERFGTWAGALDATGLPPTGFGSSRHRGQRRHWSDGAIIEAVRVWTGRSGDRRYATFAADASTANSLPAPDLIARRFGGWRRILAAIDAASERGTPRGSDLPKSHPN